MKKPQKLPRGIDIRDGSYRARLTRNGIAAEKRFETLAEARSWLERQRVELDVDDYQEKKIAAAEAKSVTLHALIEDYLEAVTPTKSENSYDAERNRLRTWQAVPWSTLSVAAIRPHHIIKWMDTEATRITRFGKTPKATTISNPVNLLSAVFKWGIQKKQLKIQNPVAGLARPEAEDPRVSIPNNDLEKLILETAKTSKARWIGPFVILAGWTAARQGEIRKLRWEWIDLENGFIVLPKKFDSEPNEPEVRITKNGTGRGIPMLPMVRNALIEWRGNQECQSGWVFPSDRDPIAPIPQGTVSHAWAQIFARIKADNPNIKHQTFHDFRHWGCTRLARYHETTLELASTTGHKTLQSLARYYNPDIAQKTADVMKKYHEKNGVA